MATRYEYYQLLEEISELKHNICKGIDVVRNSRLLQYKESLQIDTLKERGVSSEHTQVLKVEFNKYREILEKDHIAFTIKFDSWGEIQEEIIEECKINKERSPEGIPSSNNRNPFGDITFNFETTLQKMSRDGEYRGIPIANILTKMRASLH